MSIDFSTLQSPSFDWAKDFLQSPAWDFFTNNPKGNSSVFSLPVICPSIALPSCVMTESCSVVTEELPADAELHDAAAAAIDAPSTSHQAPRTPRAKKGKGKAPILSEADVRRSLRLKRLYKGFKTPACKDKNCLACSSTPPAISPSIIRNLGASFCNIDPSELTDSKLHAKTSRAKPVSRRLARRSLQRRMEMHSVICFLFCPLLCLGPFLKSSFVR
jgi:hypothetical protein